MQVGMQVGKREREEPAGRNPAHVLVWMGVCSVPGLALQVGMGS